MRLQEKVPVQPGVVAHVVLMGLALGATVVAGCGRRTEQQPNAGVEAAQAPMAAQSATASQPSDLQLAPRHPAGKGGPTAGAADLAAQQLPLPAEPTSVTPLAFAPRDAACVAETTAAARRAFAFAKSLDVDPKRLRDELDMLGKKHLTEMLGLMRLLAAWPGDPELANAARDFGRALLDRVAVGAEFHDLGRVDDHRFDEDSMSYLRACWYAEALGWETKTWRDAIAAIQPRLDESLSRRGVDQRMSFTLLYAALGLPGGEDLNNVFRASAIAALRDFRYWVQRPGNAYELTHELFGGTWRGRRPLPARTALQLRYAKKASYTLLHVHLTEKNHDPAAELVLGRRYLGEKMDDQLRFARRFLLDGQNGDGSFGFHTESLIREQKGNPRYDVKIGGNLHTTLVALWALMATCD